MNKKFSTFLVSMLLAGGMFNVNAQQKVDLGNVADDGFYYVLKIHDSDPDIPYAKSFSISVDGGKLIQVTDFELVSKANVWKATPVKVSGKVLGYQLINANGVKLQFDEAGKFTTDNSKVVYDVFKFAGNAYLSAIGTDGKPINGKALGLDGAGLALGVTGVPTNLYTLPVEELTIADLKKQLGDGFTLTIGQTSYNKDIKEDAKKWFDKFSAYSELQGNEFVGKLTPESKWSGIALKNEAGKYIVLTNKTWGDLSNSLQGVDDKAGYKFDVMTEAQVDAAEKAGTILAKTFIITQPNALSNQPLEVVAGTDYELMVAGVDGTYYLTTGAANGTGTEPGAVNEYGNIKLLSDGTSQLVGKASYTNNYDVTAKRTTENTYVVFGDDNDVDYTKFNDAVWNIKREKLDENDKVVETLVAGPTSTVWTSADQVALAYPEGQWLWDGSVFVNRESVAKLALTGLRETGTDFVFSAGGYVYTFTKAGDPISDGVNSFYLAKDNDDLLKRAFYVGTPIKATGDTVYIAKGEENGVLYLTDEAAEAVAFRLEKADLDDKAGVQDLIKHYTTYASSKTATGTANDVLNLYKYNLTDAATGEVLAYDNVNKKFILSEDADAYEPLVFKNKDLNLYNLVKGLATEDDLNDKGEYQNEKVTQQFAADETRKLFGAHNTAELQEADGVYEKVANDLFVLKEVAAGQHVSDIEGDTIKIFREAENNFYLYAGKDNFLELTSFVDPTDNGGAFYVDSAAGKGTWRQEYLLALDPEFVPAGKYCPICGESDCAHAEATMGFTEGLYLVNLVDSAKVAKEAGVKDKDNKFMFQNYVTDQPYYRLGFVPARHVEDSLIIASTNDTLIVSSNNFADAKVCDFAFHYVADDAFIIETAYDYTEKVDPLTEEVTYTATEGYIKYHNGVPVVTPVREEAEVFLFEETTEKPTDNEEISTSEVKVIAGNGQIIIAGAAGKKVVVSNILGQVVANTVITSDNATIAAPQGIVVVAVEGEEAVKAIVK